MQSQTQGKPRWAQRIVDLRKSLGLNQIAFAKKVGATQGSVSLWESGANKPAPDTFLKIAKIAPETDKYFFLETAGLPKEFFLGGIGETLPSEMVRAAERIVGTVMFTPNRNSAGEQSRQVEAVAVPVLKDAVAAGNPLTIDERDIDELVPLAASKVRKGAKLYGLKISGDSMEPILMDGWTVFVDVSKRDPKKLVNRLVAARVREGVTVKWLRNDGKHYMLVAQHVSPRHQTQVLTEDVDWSVAGEVIGWWGEPPMPRK